jgi:hypothetical protein
LNPYGGSVARKQREQIPVGFHGKQDGRSFGLVVLFRLAPQGQLVTGKIFNGVLNNLQQNKSLSCKIVRLSANRAMRISALGGKERR